MNKFLNGLKETNELGYTTNGAIKRTTTKSKVLDMFALGGAFRSRSDADCILLFKEAFAEDKLLALRCLFYLRDVRGGQGERRFFRVCMKWLAQNCADTAKKMIVHVAEYGRWDDLYLFIDTPLENEALSFIKKQLALDVQSKTPSLLAKWLKSENTSSKESQRLGKITRKYLGMTSKQYRKTLSILRERINVLERLMSAGEWDKIEFDKIPSKAGLKYRNAFARHDVERMMACQDSVVSYADFAKNKDTKVNADALYPYEVVKQALNIGGGFWYGHRDVALDDTNRLMINKYWENLKDYFQNAKFNGMAVVDTSGSMYGRPMEVAVSLGMYCADKAQGPFHNNFITFSSQPKFVEIQGVDFVDKVRRVAGCSDWGMNTNIEAAFDLMLRTAIRNSCSQDEIPENLIIISDMEFDYCTSWHRADETLFETMKRKWESHGYKMPKLTFWNVNATSNNIPMKDDGNVRYVSGFSPVLFEQVMQDLTAYDLMLNKLNSERYQAITC